TQSLNQGEGFRLDDGRIIAVMAAAEPLLAVRHGNLARIAWHVGNRHTPCQIADDHILIREDKVLQAMLEGLGASVTQVTAPFTPEGGAYGHGRTAMFTTETALPAGFARPCCTGASSWMPCSCAPPWRARM
ncbi:MAG: urease accessory protein UreE, partial [Candidatus Puniceispirillaceae bacterium]